MPTALLLVLVGLSLFVVKCGCFALGGTGLSPNGARPLVHRCQARPVWSGLRDSCFVLDALVESCDDPAVPCGTPFSLRLVPPGRDDYLFSRLRTSIERGHPLSVELEADTGGWRARLCAQGWTRVLDLEHACGWPLPSP